MCNIFLSMAYDEAKIKKHIDNFITAYYCLNSLQQDLY